LGERVRRRREWLAVKLFNARKSFADPSLNRRFLLKGFTARAFRHILRPFNTIGAGPYSCRGIFLGEDRTLSWGWCRTTGIAIGFFIGIREW
jgi:hypothetical protein